MKKNMISIFQSLAVLLVFTLLVSLVLALLYLFQFTSIALLNGLQLVLGFILYAIAGFVLGRMIHKQTFFIAMGVSLVLGLILLTTIEKTLMNVLILCAKMLVYALTAALTRKRID